jgi:hypothetical protein
LAVLSSVTLAKQLHEQFGNFQTPHLAPTRAGSVILEWATPQEFLEIEYNDDAWTIVGTLRKQCRVLSSDQPIGADLAKFYRWLTSDSENW